MLRIEISRLALPSSDGNSGLTITPAEGCDVATTASDELVSSTGIDVGAGRARLTFHRRAVLQSFQHATGTGDNFYSGLQAAGDFDIRFAGDAGRDFDEFHLVGLVQNINAFLFFRLFTLRSWRAAGKRWSGRRRRRRFFHDCL